MIPVRLSFAPGLADLQVIRATWLVGPTQYSVDHCSRPPGFYPGGPAATHYDYFARQIHAGITRSLEQESRKITQNALLAQILEFVA